MDRYQFIQDCTEPWSVQLLCQVLAVSPGGYCQWRHRPAATPAPWQMAAQAAFTRHARRYGTRRLRAELHAEGHAVGRYALRTWLHRHDLQALSTCPHRLRTTEADPAAVMAENRLLVYWPPPPRTRSGSATLPICPWWAGAGVTWPPGVMPAPGGSWAGIWPPKCPPNWCSTRWNKP